MVQQVAVQVRGKNDQPTTVTISALGSPQFPGLVVHRTMQGAPGDVAAVGKTYTLTHVPSGLSVARGFRTRKVAVAAAQELAHLVNWNTSAGYLKRRAKSLRQPTWEIID